MKESNNIRMFAVLEPFIDTSWDRVKPLIEKSLVYIDGKYSLEDVYSALKNDKMLLWVGYDDSDIIFAIVTQIVTFPRKKILSLNLVAGKDYKSWLDKISDFKDFAKLHHCDFIEGYCRPGWEKSITPLGFKKVHTLFKLEL